MGNSVSEKILLKNASLVDLDRMDIIKPRDILIGENKVEEIGTRIEFASSYKLIDLSEKFAIPGLIDFHTHIFPGGTSIEIDPDFICLNRGVTAAVDCGSCGTIDFHAFKDFAKNIKTKVYCFINISKVGIIDEGELLDINNANPEEVNELINYNRDFIIGLKVRVSKNIVGNNGLKPLELALRVARIQNLPVMVHITNPIAPIPEILSMIGKADIVSYCFHGRGYTIINKSGNVINEVQEAKKRGVIFDSAHGSMNFNFQIAKLAINEGFLPDLITTDISKKSINGPVFDLATTISKFIALGVPFLEVIKRCTLYPSKFLPQENDRFIWKKGMEANISVFEYEKGNFIFHDSDGNYLSGKKRIVPFITIYNNKIFQADKSITLLKSCTFLDP